ncbi:MAG: helix-turn-helix domain-containing protein [Acidimicrobiales bacterium]|nr:helix-turn-helix domain-containing protein [Acidimicrobiales bacterium]
MDKRERLLTPEELAEELGVPVATLYQWRYRRTGPVVLRIGRHLRYRRDDVDAWLASQASPRPAA